MDFSMFDENGAPRRRVNYRPTTTRSRSPGHRGGSISSRASRNSRSSRSPSRRLSRDVMVQTCGGQRLPGRQPPRMPNYWEQGSIPDLSDSYNEQLMNRSVHVYGNQYVEQVTPDTIERFIQQNPRNLVAYHHPSCGHCIDMEPEYGRAAEQLMARGSDARLAAMDMGEYGDFGRQQGVEGYPTIRSYGNNLNDYREYSGARDANSFIKYLTTPSRQGNSRNARKR